MQKDDNSLSQSLKSIRSNLGKRDYDATDLRYMSSLSEAILAKTPSASKKILYVALIAIVGVITWAAFAKVDEIARGGGKIVPSGQNQIVQNLEGGIVEQIYIKEGDYVTRGQTLIKIDNKTFISNYGESEKRIMELEAKYLRLDAQANDKEFKFDKIRDANNTQSILHELSLYRSNQEQLEEQINIIKEQINQREADVVGLEAKVENLQRSYELTEKEIAITSPLVKKGIVSQVDYIQLQKRLNDTRVDLDGARLSIPALRSSIKESQNKINETVLSFKNKAKQEFNQVAAEISRLKEARVGLSDKVGRTLIKSPVNGVISKLNVHTVSGVIKPGADIIEIVPDEDTLIAEVKVKPSDVAFLRPELDAMIKVTAYDFGIYGGLKGKVIQISADTQSNEKKPDETYYLVRIKTEKNYLGTAQHPLKIKVGMIVSADIITGKKTVLDYILKPILKVKEAALRER